MEQEAVVNEAKTNLVGLIANIQSHEDIAIRDTTSLNPGENIDPFDWTEKRNILEKQLYDATIAYKLALKIMNDNFPEKPDEEEIEDLGI